MAEAVAEEAGRMAPEALFDMIMAREGQGSTFFNEGAAFPHVRIEGLSAPFLALALTREGVSDSATEKPVGIVFLLLAPAHAPDDLVKLLAAASRAAQNRHLLRNLKSARTPEEVLASIRAWESSNLPGEG
jgi:mannitol/fructose-specific phosphotransferase system IIA component (Ntr-type)